ncbi:hypothetical protein LBW62_25955, partial [Ralstonia solanacearum]|uniref:hypothetical protein n=1 Tax=Ralstonia solanacearum TaxID=305 RepID=UPI00230578CC
GGRLFKTLDNKRGTPSQRKSPSPLRISNIFRKFFIQQTSFSAVCGHQPDVTGAALTFYSFPANQCQTFFYDPIGTRTAAEIRSLNGR